MLVYAYTDAWIGGVYNVAVPGSPSMKQPTPVSVRPVPDVPPWAPVAHAAFARLRAFCLPGAVTVEEVYHRHFNNDAIGLQLITKADATAGSTQPGNWATSLATQAP